MGPYPQTERRTAMISSETQIDVLAEINRNLDRIASALEVFNNEVIDPSSGRFPGYLRVRNEPTDRG